MRRSPAFLALPVVFAFACSDQPTSVGWRPCSRIARLIRLMEPDSLTGITGLT